ncbi:hypothetical protein [Arhodomonas aquaeolei]|uniref:hypothetical protein n=1 Tax=Arhodomonas aquaeolei TaxID=2369 RepID=UPI0012EB590F|nr:hypothetical protein [Arhodomonas aquaeolei]
MSKVSEIKGRWIVGSLSVLLMLPVVFIIGLVVGINIEDAISLSQDTMSSWVSAFATVTIAVLTIVLAKETWALRLIQLSQIEQIRKDTIKPSVNLFLKSSPAAFNFINLHVVNNGPGTAQNIRFRFINASPDTKDVFDYLLTELTKLVIMEKGISSLSSGEHRTSYVFSFIDLHEKFGEKALECITEVDITFEDTEGTKYQTRSFFNFTEYKGITELGGGDPLYKISSQLEKIQKEVGHFASGFKKLKTDVYTSADREKEREELERQWVEQQRIDNESS